ncbi:hypothetical protein FACS1894169_06160 [Bacteroidia bacterium]|nr:hypothetical protein FACS1894169_06160 [Bacteroidia bacterium]
MVELIYFYPGKDDCIVNAEVHGIHSYTGIYNAARWSYKSLEYSNWLSKLFHCRRKLKKRIIELFEENVTIIAYPSPEYKYIIAIYSGSHNFPIPNNAVVYNLDGSIHKILTPPKVINDFFQGGDPQGKSFYNVNWDIKDGKIFLCLTINIFDMMEVRELNAETGEFSTDWSRVYRL